MVKKIKNKNENKKTENTLTIEDAYVSLVEATKDIELAIEGLCCKECAFVNLETVRKITRLFYKALDEQRTVEV